MAINIQDIIARMQTAQDQANAANQARYRQGLNNLYTGRQQMMNDYAGAIRASQLVGRQARQDVNRGAKRNLAQGRQHLVTSGLGNTTIQQAMARGMEEDRRRAMQAVEEGMANRRSGLLTQRATAGFGARQGIANFIAGRNDVAPDPALYAQLAQQAAAAGDGSKVTVFGGLGPNARAGLDAFGNPLGSKTSTSPFGSGGGSGYDGMSDSGGSGGSSYKPTQATGLYGRDFWGETPKTGAMQPGEGWGVWSIGGEMGSMGNLPGAEDPVGQMAVDSTKQTAGPIERGARDEASASLPHPYNFPSYSAYRQWKENWNQTQSAASPPMDEATWSARRQKLLSGQAQPSDYKRFG